MTMTLAPFMIKPLAQRGPPAFIGKRLGPIFLSIASVMAATGPLHSQPTLSVDGIIESTLGGFTFPDGSTQDTAAALPFVVVPDDTPDIPGAVAGLVDGGTVFVRTMDSCYTLTEMIHISRSNVSLIGEQGVCLRLADSVNRPVILIGSTSETVPEPERIFDVYVSGLFVDANKDGQDMEGATGLPNIKNNAVAVRRATRVHLDRLTLTNARSGGLVISQESSKVFVSGSTFSHNFFDGIAIAGSSEVLVEHFVSELNGASGLSIDTGTNTIQVRDGQIQKNDDNGIFIRFSDESSFSDLTIVDNCNYGVFASHASTSAEGLIEIDFSQLRVFRNLTAGFFFATSPAEDSVDNFLTNSRFGGNGGIGLADEIVGTGSNDAITEEQNTVVELRVEGPSNHTCP